MWQNQNPKARFDILIGIDPDVTKSGIAIKRGGVLEVSTMSFFDLLNTLKAIANSNVLVRIEAGWLNKKSNFHGNKAQSKVVGERIAAKVGANHEVGKKIVEMCEYVGVAYELGRPMTSKWTPQYFERITGIKTRNQECVDAAVLIL